MDLSGFYYDPKHGHCLRKIAFSKRKGWQILGAYGDDEPPHRPGEAWVASVKVSGLHLEVDFHTKSVDHARVYAALYCPTERIIRWQDGNTWVRLYDPFD